MFDHNGKYAKKFISGRSSMVGHDIWDVGVGCSNHLARTNQAVLTAEKPQGLTLCGFTIRRLSMKQNDLLIRNENIQRLFDWYVQGIFLVNRKYQRKLVWTIEEKQQFVNSILSDYPVPLFLLATTSDGKYEIIDGMQRLNSIFSFIKGEFPVDFQGSSGYFDLQTMAITKSLLDNGDLVQKTPLIDREFCTRYVNYQLPLSVTSFDDRFIEDIFRRINATGRQLSAQDLRQAGSTNAFAELVRKIATYIRRDSSPSDILLLSQMEEISLSNRYLPYGINISDTFWVKNGIVTTSNMRVSRDEELVAYILLYILLGENVSPSAKSLDKIYGYEEDNNLLIEKSTAEIEKRTPERIQECFLTVLDQLQKTIDASGKTFDELLFGEQVAGKARSFQVVFLSFYNLLTNGNVIKNHENLAKKIDGIGAKLLSDISSDRWGANERQILIQAIQGVIETEFTKAEGVDPAVDEWISKLENLLMQSKIEQQFFDFKIGLHTISSNPPFNAKCFSKVIKTLTAMANTQKKSTGYVLVGIADSDNDAKLFSKTYNSKPRIFNGFQVTGVQDEIRLKYKNADEYFMNIKNLVKREPINAETQSYILRNMRLVNYYDKLILVFSLSSGDSPCPYNGKFYERHGTSVEEISDATQISNLFKRFC